LKNLRILCHLLPSPPGATPHPRPQDTIRNPEISRRHPISPGKHRLVPPPRPARRHSTLSRRSDFCGRSITHARPPAGARGPRGPSRHRPRARRLSPGRPLGRAGFVELFRLSLPRARLPNTARTRHELLRYLFQPGPRAHPSRYSRPVNLGRFDAHNWMTSEKNVWVIAEHLCEIPHSNLLTHGQEKRLSRVDLRNFEAGMVRHRSK